MKACSAYVVRARAIVQWDICMADLVLESSRLFPLRTQAQVELEMHNVLRRLS